MYNIKKANIFRSGIIYKIMFFYGILFVYSLFQVHANTEISAPTAVTASDGTYSDKVRISWNSSSGAYGYDVYRSRNSGSSTAELIFYTANTSEDDTSAEPGVIYYYWVKAKSGAGSSGFSSSDTGYAGNSDYVIPSSSSVGSGSGSTKFTVSSGLLVGLCLQVEAAVNEYILSDGWKLQSSLKVNQAGAEVSSPGFSTAGWHDTSVPTTIVGALVTDGTYQDPFYGQNLKSITGPEFDKPWWFRKSFTLPAFEQGKTMLLQLRGINYRANVWLNGKLVANDREVVGPVRFFKFFLRPYPFWKFTIIIE